MQAPSGQDIAIKKALEEFRKQLAPVLAVDVKTQLISSVKDELSEQIKAELRKEMKLLSTKVAKDISQNSETMKHVLTEQVRKIEQTSKDMQSSTMKALKSPVKTKAGALRRSVAAAMIQQKRKPNSRKPTYQKLSDVVPVCHTETGTSAIMEDDASTFNQSLLDADPRSVGLGAGELPAASTTPLLETRGQVAVDKILNHESFDIVMAIIILVGAIMMGVSLQYGVHDYMFIYDVLAVFLFSVELLARFYCYRWAFFKMDGYEWNIFDLCIVLSQLISVVSQTSSATTGLKSLRGLRSLRAIRSLRVLRSLRLLRFVEEFRSVVISTMASLRSTLGVLSLFSFGLYLFGACICSEVWEQKRALGEHEINPQLDQYFGTLATSMLSLYESVTGGLSWSFTVSIFLENEDYMMAFAFCIFVALCVFVLLNVITAIFTGQAMLALQDDQDAMIVKDIDMLFQKQDLITGDITWEEFQGMLTVPEMVRLFKSLNIDVSEARQLYRLLDTESVGVVDYNEFINGCLRLRGPAKSLELVLLMKDTSQMNLWIEKKLNSLHAEMQSLQVSSSIVSQQIQGLAPPEEVTEEQVAPAE
eukprot:TRINITY_DN17583_c0_g1_i1.p1 TRINITY_DN17583_c0_g1~~TRINITY_DN17583_c0_g1_i1.p1  ORF type:complete len:590 (+),score=149.68 TRINITY_DN17583_c0_g1_i1:76-1845(+)